jgi:hypothetical protein
MGHPRYRHYFMCGPPTYLFDATIEQMSQKTHGELLFETYLTSQSIAFEYEPDLRPVSNKRVDYVIEHSTHGKIYLEVKDIHQPFSHQGPSAFDRYEPIHSHIEAGAKKFKDLPDELCAIVMVAGPNSFVDLMDPTTMLGAMYGDFGFKIPFNPELGRHDGNQISSGFQPGRGKMVRKGTFLRTRVAALISLVSYSTFAKEAALYARTDDGRSSDERWEDALNGRSGISQEPTPCVTVWENGTAKRRLPQNLFRGPMDAWWTADDGMQSLSIVGERRLALKIDR